MNNDHLDKNIKTFGFSQAVVWLKSAMRIYSQQVGLFNGLVIVFILTGIVLNLLFAQFSHLLLVLLSPFVSAASLWGADGKLRDKGPINQRLAELLRPHSSSLMILGSCYLLLALVLGVLERLIISYMGLDLQTYTTENPAPLSITLIYLIISLVLYLPLYVATFFAPALIVFQQQKPISALQLSAVVALKNWRPLLAYNFILILAVVIPVSLVVVFISLLTDTSGLRSLLTLIAGFFLIAGIIYMTALTWIMSYVSFTDIFELPPENGEPDSTFSEF